VAWITERKNALALPFYLLSLLFYLRFERSGRLRACAASLALFLLALLSKTSVVMLPLVLLGCAWWQRARVTRKDLLRALPFFALAGALAAVELWFHSHHVLARTAARPEGFFSRAAAAGWAVWFYLYKALLPWNLAMVYPRWSVDPRALAAWLPDLALLMGLALAWRYRRSWGRPLLFAGGYFVVSLLPVLGFADISFMKYSLVADPWQYVAIIGIVALAAGAGVRAWERLPPTPRKQAVVGAAILVIALGVLTWQRCGLFENENGSDAPLWQDTVKKNPRSYIAQLNFGKALVVEAGSREITQQMAQAYLQTAMMQFQVAARLAPREPEAHENLANILFALGRYAPAAEQYRQVLNIRNDPAIRERLNEALARQGKAAEDD
jgi:tetratricopeptide (TPR) repeat protein